MFRSFIVFCILNLTILNGGGLNNNVLEDKIKNIIGQKDYGIHKNFINMLFKDKDKFIVNDKIKYFSLFKELKNNGLLNLRLDKPQDIVIEFFALNKSIKAYKVLNDTMQSLGYRYFFTKSLDKNETNQLVWKIALKAEYMMDPVVLLNELQQKNCKVLNIEKRPLNNWYYEIDFDAAVLDDAIKIDKNEKVKFQKPLQEYFIMVDEVSSLQVISRKLNRWFPYIVFYDKDLKVLKVIKKDRFYKGYKTKAPKETKYIKITDLYNLINIKRGLTVIVR